MKRKVKSKTRPSPFSADKIRISDHDHHGTEPIEKIEAELEQLGINVGRFVKEIQIIVENAKSK